MYSADQLNVSCARKYVQEAPDNPQHDVRIVQFEFLPTEQADETYLNIYVLIRSDIHAHRDSKMINSVAILPDQ